MLNLEKFECSFLLILVINTNQNFKKMRPLLYVFLLGLLLGCQNSRHGFDEQESKETQALREARIKLPNGWSLTPVGNSLTLQDLPLNLVVSPSKTLLAVTNNGQRKQFPF